MKPISIEAYKLLHEGALALSDVESNGIRIDVPRLHDTMNKVQGEIDELSSSIKSSKVFKRWKRKFGPKTNLASRSQFGTIFFDEMGYECKVRTKTGRPKVDEMALQDIDDPFVADYLRFMKLEKVLHTSLMGIDKEVDERGILHPSFNLNTVETYRSSSDSPNFQNFPVRDKDLSEIVRKCFIPRKGRHLVEIDYGGIEVKIAACYHKDPAMLRYLNDPKSDMHRDVAEQVYCLKPGYLLPREGDDDVMLKMLGGTRHVGKNSFTFPEFYGANWVSIALDLWNKARKLTLRNGKPMHDHLARLGITELGTGSFDVDPEPDTFQYHLRAVEQHFWNERFPVYRDWKRSWWDKYCSRGYCDTLTGFRIAGVYDRKQIINYPVQGSAFHCLLWSLIKLNRWLKKKGYRTKIVGQIHDSLVADVPAEELRDFLEMAQFVMVDRLVDNWKWIIAPMEIEADVCDLGASWFDKRPYKMAA